jgi:hypothetical protein
MNEQEQQDFSATSMQISRKPSHWWRALPILVVAAGLLGSPQASAISIAYTVTHISGSQYQYDYTVENDGSLPLSADIDWFNILFDYTLYDNLVLVAAPGNWDIFLAQPSGFAEEDGIFDALADPGPGIASGNSLGGFSVSFDWLGAGTPGAQPFEIGQELIDPPDCTNANPCFDVIASGFTEAPAVPVPGAIWLLASGLIALRQLRSGQRTITAMN